jgi:hypothetical protein
MATNASPPALNYNKILKNGSNIRLKISNFHFILNSTLERIKFIIPEIEEENKIKYTTMNDFLIKLDNIKDKKNKERLTSKINYIKKLLDDFERHDLNIYNGR